MPLVNIINRWPAKPSKTVFVDNFFCAQVNGRLSLDIVPHLGLMTLAAVLEGAGHSAEIFDPKLLFVQDRFRAPDERFIAACVRNLLGRRADVIGFTAFGLSLPFVIRVAAEIRRVHPAQKIVLGGPHATIVGKRILRRFPHFDAVATYEAESIIVPLIESLVSGGDLSTVANLHFERDGEIVSTSRQSVLPDMDRLPDPLLNLYPIEQLRVSELSIEAGRGCPFQCTFCSTANFFQRRYRMKSNQRMIEEMERARDRYGIRMFNLNHDLFGLVKSNLREFCTLARGRELEWKCSMRPDSLNEDLVDALASAGCRHIYFGVETGSPKLQRIIRKNLDLNRAKHTIAATVHRGIHCTTSFITGYPDECSDDQDRTLDFLGDLLRLDPHRVHPQLHILSPEPGSAMAEDEIPICFDGIGPEADQLFDIGMIHADPDIFSVFYHYRGGASRWRTVLMSVFVTHIVPILGNALTTHVFVNRFSGSLAAFFRKIVPQNAPESFDLESALDALWRGLDSAILEMSDEAPYLEDLIRLSRILELRNNRPPSSSGVWLACFGQDVRTLADAVASNPEAVPVFDRRSGVERWFAIRFESAEKAQIGEVPGSAAASVSRQPAVMLGYQERAMRDLQVSYVEI